MSRKRIAGLLVLLLCLSGVFLLTPSHAPIDQWSSSLTEGAIEIAEVASDYGIAARRYAIPQEEYRTLVALLRSVTEANSSRKPPKDLERIDCRLALHCNGKLWLFHCYENELLGLMFHDAETGAYYGCEGKLLYIDSPLLWEYIVNTAAQKAK